MIFGSMLQNGISGMSATANQLNVTANNIANSNTTAFKASRASFADILETTEGTISSGNGVRLGNISTSFASGPLQQTQQATDMGISGSGFFLLRRGEAAIADVLTRAGKFDLQQHLGNEPNALNLVTPEGNFVQGYNLSSSTSSTNVLTDILIKSVSPQSATSHVEVVANIESKEGQIELTNTPLFDRWDGRATNPLANSDFEYSTAMTIYGPADESASNTAPSATGNLNFYFDSTNKKDEKEFLITCDPLDDQRIIDTSGARYSSGGTTTNKGAGALLYGILHFTSNGELGSIDCWRVPPDGNVAPDTDTNRITLGRGENYFSFDYNFTGTAQNNTSTLSFGNTLKPRSVSSSEPSYTDFTQKTPISANSSWNTIFDAWGNRVRSGDTITVEGFTGEGKSATYTYTVNPAQSMQDFLSGLQNKFSCTARIENGSLVLTDSEVGGSQLAISKVSYTDAAGNSPATKSSIAQIFGKQNSSFIVDEENLYERTGLGTTNYSTPSSVLMKRQDGHAKGQLTDLMVNSNGVILGKYSNGEQIEQARLALATTTNVAGLMEEGGNIFTISDEAGDLIIGASGSGPFGTISNFTLEQSNVDYGREIANVIFTQRAFQANTKSITTADDLLEKLLQMVR